MVCVVAVRSSSKGQRWLYLTLPTYYPYLILPSPPSTEARVLALALRLRTFQGFPAGECGGEVRFAFF